MLLPAGGAPVTPPMYRDTNSGGYRVYLEDHSRSIGIVRRVYVDFTKNLRRWVACPDWGIPELPPCTSKEKARDALWAAWQRSFVELPQEDDPEHESLCRPVVP